jgi:DNA polymerase III sliding clamp (beta) subunit (PCNA family)
MLIRLEALELAANAGSADDSRYALDCIQVHANGDAVVTDGFSFLRIKAAVEEPNLFDVLLPKKEMDSKEEVLVNAEDARAFKAACRRAIKKAGKGKKGKPDPIHVAVSKNADAVTMATADGVTSRRFEMKERATDLKYPDVQKTIPAGKKREILLSVDLLIKICRTLKALRCVGVTLAMTDKALEPIVLKSTSIIGDIDGAIVPMRDAEEKQSGAA